MLEVKRKARRSHHCSRWWLVLGAAMLALGIGILPRMLPDEATLPEDPADPSGVLVMCESSQISSMTITHRNGDTWSAVQSAEGTLTLTDDPTCQVSASKAAALLKAASSLTYQEVLAEDASAYDLADFGLENPLLTLRVTYADGSSQTIHIGNLLALDESNAYYMTAQGDSRLFAMDKGSAEELMVERAALHTVTQPTLHKARFDRITLTDGQGQVTAQWSLQGSIGGNAQDRWLLTAPVQYPADGESISTLQDNLVNLRLGAYVGEATPENLTVFGFDTPRLVLILHQAAGSIGTTGTDGIYSVTDWPEDTFTLTVGGSKNDMVDYVCVDNGIYLSNHFTLEVLLDMDPISTLSRYVVPVALGNLSSLTIRTGEEELHYQLTRTEQVADNNELLTDASGNVVYDITCTCNGSSIPYGSFESAYNDLLKVTVSGSLPPAWQDTGSPHTTFIFQAVTGESYTLSLSPFDPLHDAVTLDGHALFYLIRSGMTFDVEQS